MDIVAKPKTHQPRPKVVEYTLKLMAGDQAVMALLDSLPTAIYVCNSDGTIRYFNRLAADLWGREPILGSLADRFCGAYRMYRLDGGPLPHSECPMAEVLRTGRAVHQQEVVIERRDGLRKRAVVNIEPLFDGSGMVTGAVNCFQEASGHHRAKPIGRKSRAKSAESPQGSDRSRVILDALPAAIYATDTAGRITYFNEAAATLWGCRPELGKAEFCGSWKLYWPDGRPMAHNECPMAVSLTERRPIRGKQAIAERPDGTRIPFMAYPTPLNDKSGNWIGGVNMLLDITEKQELEEIKQRLVSIIMSSDDAIVSKDLNGIINSWNPGAERMFGYKSEEVVGKSITILIPPDRVSEETVILSKLRRGEKIDHYETVRRRKDGTLFDISLAVSPVRDASGKIVGASKIARDISERRQAQARQELLSRELEHRTKNIFMVVQSVVSQSFEGKHDIEGAKTAALSRLSSLAQAHVLLLKKDWRGANLMDIVMTETSPYPGRVIIDGPDFDLNPPGAQSFAMALHELVTNAAKYGALSDKNGRIFVRWSVAVSKGQQALHFRWHERGGPPVTAPTRRGFGNAVLVKIMGDYTDGMPVLDFAADGFRYELSCPIDLIEMEATCLPSLRP